LHNTPRGGINAVLRFDTITNLVKSYHIVTLCSQVMNKIHNFKKILFESSIICHKFAPKTRKVRKVFLVLLFIIPLGFVPPDEVCSPLGFGTLMTLNQSDMFLLKSACIGSISVICVQIQIVSN
jgi:hypothetical protein